MRLLEYQAKQRFAASGIPVPQGRLARTSAEAAAAARDLGTVAIKAQVPIGGRGKAGGIAVAHTPEEAEREAARILAMDIRGYPVSSVWCETGLDIAAELYLGITLDRDRRRLAVIFSAAGGMEIEQVAADTPERIAKLWPDPFAGPHPFELRRLAFAGLAGSETPGPHTPGLVGQLAAIGERLFALALALDATTCEINPLALTSEGKLVAADGKVEIDPNAEVRQKNLLGEIPDEDQMAELGGEQLEREARRRGLTYVHLDGEVGVIGNGAGLTMNTVDLVKQQGGDPANFLDIGGGAGADKVRNALEMVLLDPKVRGVFINVFGGITRGDEVARGVIAARDELHITKPLVVRMTGTMEEEGRRLLEDAGIVPAKSPTEAARTIVALTRET
ncbi:MAG: ADP-forming succinate--CoA ligase subunit beta [Candidatus Dormibacteraeota bacterium]|nr:ADP-forming succinate--CoA ligase subunit beta [Candidatus Dormibacteraeota bacterium]